MNGIERIMRAQEKRIHELEAELSEENKNMLYQVLLYKAVLDENKLLSKRIEELDKLNEENDND